MGFDDGSAQVRNIRDPGRMSGKTTPQGHAVAVTTQEASEGLREKTMRVREHREQLIGLGIDFISGSA